MAAPAKATRGNDFDPISSSCRPSSRNSKGGVTAARTTCQEKRPSSPNHSKKPLIRAFAELTAEDTGRLRTAPLRPVSPSAAIFMKSRRVLIWPHSKILHMKARR